MTGSEELWIKRRRHFESAEEWQTWQFFYPLTRNLEQGRVSDRKLRLLTAVCVGCLRGTAHLGEREWVIEALERAADAPPNPTDVQTVALALRETRLRCTEVMGGVYWQASIDYPEEPETDPWRVTWGTADAVIIALARQERVAAGLPDECPDVEQRSAAEGRLCDSFREIFSNPYRPIIFAQEWRTDTVLALAREMYESRDFNAMPILADALQDAGCDSDDILNHCRDANQVHVRGCWVVDLVLGKE